MNLFKQIFAREQSAAVASAAYVPPLEVYRPPAGVVGGDGMGGGVAYDHAARYYANFNHHSSIASGAFEEGVGFLGYAYLSGLSMRAEYRNIVMTRAEEATRKWGTIVCDNDEDKSRKIADINAAMEHMGVRALINRALEIEGFMGMVHILIDIEGDDVSTRLSLDAGIYKGAALKFRVIEPQFTTPCHYNSTDPMADDYYEPEYWWIMGRQVHKSRMITIVSNPVPQMLKAVYNFGGVALAQMCKPYVDNWLRTRQSVSDLVHSFSVMVLKTDLTQLMHGGHCGSLINRVAQFVRFRDNRGLQVIDNETEDFSNVSASLGGLDKLQAQSQEQIASVARIPLVKLLGVTPSGLNASSDGEIRCFYDTIAALQERVVMPALKRIIDAIQACVTGSVDEGVRFKFLPLWELDEAGRAANEKVKADIRASDIQSGVISPEEARQALVGDDDCIYGGVDLSGPAPLQSEADYAAFEDQDNAPGGDQRGHSQEV